MRLAYVREIERCAEECLIPAERAAVLLKLAKFTTLGKQSIELTAKLDRLAPEPDLRQLSREDLERILAAPAIETTATELPEE